MNMLDRMPEPLLRESIQKLLGHEGIDSLLELEENASGELIYRLKIVQINPETAAKPAWPYSLEALEREAIEKTLKKWSGNRTRAAAELRISRRTIINKINQYGL